VIVDASVLVAIAIEEPPHHRYFEALLASPSIQMSAANYLEAAIVVDRYPDPRAAARFDALVDRLGITIEPVTPEQARLARNAYQRFGKGSGHRAKLNFGDCFAYALAKDLDEPLLFIGQDFLHTDIPRALT
jgi:ribonuclease VapC